jgi:NAD(P)-dependent dehydrogenase (short-subunit alcohol dehydrogenase family)
VSGERAGGVVVTGASTGIGRACALRLDAAGLRVFAGVRRDADAAELRGLASGRLVPLPLDVTRDDSLAAAAGAVARDLGEAPLAALVNNAGLGVFGPLEWTPPSLLREILEVNVVGVAAATRAFLPLLRRARGRIVNLGSVSGRVAPPYLGAYAASKFALEGLSDALRRELAGLGVSVALIEAGRVDTPIWTKALESFEALAGAVPEDARSAYAAAPPALRAGAVRGGGLPPEAVAEVVLRALTAPRPRARYLVGGDARRRARLRFLPDGWQDRLLLGRTGRGPR